MSRGSKEQEPLQATKKKVAAPKPGMTAGAEKQNFTKVPPKRHAYRHKERKDDTGKGLAINQRRNGSPRRNPEKQLHDTSSELNKKRSDHQLLYKITYINPTSTSGNNQLAAKKKKNAIGRDGAQKAVTHVSSR